MREIANPSLSDRTTIRLGGNALVELQPENLDDLLVLEDFAKREGAELFCLGRGSNILAADGKLPYILVNLKFADFIEPAGERNGKILIKAGAGTPLAKLIRYCIKNELSGLEGLAGIPGTVGGAVAMNAGSFGTETAKMAEEIGICLKGKISVINSSMLQPKYRSLEIRGLSERAIITDVIFGLTQGVKSVISKGVSLNFFKKKSRQPILAWSAGCAFKNPPNSSPAGLLLEQAGFKGKKYGGLSFSDQHANFLINEGSGTATAALDFLEEAREAVRSRFGVELQPEVRIVQ